MRLGCLLLALCALVAAATPAPSATAAASASSRPARPVRTRLALRPLLASVADWITDSTHLPSNNLTNTSDTLKTSIFINGNLARVLVAAWKVFSASSGGSHDDATANNNGGSGNGSGNGSGGVTAAQASKWLEVGLAWCDTLCDIQHTTTTHDGRPVGGWWDTGYSELFIADTGTAVTALAVCADAVRAVQEAQEAQEVQEVQEVRAVRAVRSSSSSSSSNDEGGSKPTSEVSGSEGGRSEGGRSKGRYERYMATLTAFAEFVANGTASTPQCSFSPNCAYDAGKGETTSTWLVARGNTADPDYGALGDGYVNRFVYS